MFVSHRLQAVALALGVALLVPVASASALPRSMSFGFSNRGQPFIVPAGVHQIHLTGWGGSGGAGGFHPGLYAAPGGLGARIDLDVPVTPLDVLTIDVGGHGGAGNDQIAGDGGGAGSERFTGGSGGRVNQKTLDGTAGGGGGGATVVIDTANQPILLAGGGGGGGGGGNQSDGANGGQGGDSGTNDSGHCDPRRGPGEYGNGPGGGAGGRCGQPNGPGGVSGAGEVPGSRAGTGGGGGGGLMGGNGGASGGNGAGGGGGGGGAGTSSWSSRASNVLVTNGTPGSGGVTVSWNTSPPVGVAQSAMFTSLQQFIVPAGVSELTLTGWGASGGAGGGPGEGTIAPRGGYGAVIRERVPVNPGDILSIDAGRVGGSGTQPAGVTYDPIPGGSGGLATLAAKGGDGGPVTVREGGNGPLGNANYVGNTGGGGGAATLVTDTTTSTVLLNAGGGGGAGGDSNHIGGNGGPGANAGSPLGTGDVSDGNGLFGSGTSTAGMANGAGGSFATAFGARGESATNSTQGNARGTGGGGGGGARGGGAGHECSGFSCALSAGGGGAGSSTWVASARDVSFGNALAGRGAVRISWVQAPATTIEVAASPTAVVAGRPVTLTATVAAPDAPAGTVPVGTVFFVDADTGRIGSGQPSATAPYTTTVTTTLPEGTHHVSANFGGDPVFVGSTSPEILVNVIPQLSVKTTSLPDVEVGESYSAKLAATGGVAPYTWSLATGSDLPAGLRLDAATGEISGMPTTTGSTEFAVRVSDAGAPDQTADESLTLAVKDATLAISGVTPDLLVAGAENVPVTVTGARFAPGVELTASDRRITFSAVTVTDATTLTAQVSAPDAIPAGAYDLTATEGAANATCSGCLHIGAKPTPTPATSPTPNGAGRTPTPVGVTRIVRAPSVFHHNQVRFTVRCAAASCSGQATATVKGKRVATASFALAPGATRRVTFRLNATGRALLARSKKLAVQVTITQRRPDGRSQRIAKVRLVIRAAGPARHR
jgi:Big-like domain-containing protein/putative Ig domain-containing protein